MNVGVILLGTGQYEEMLLQAVASLRQFFLPAHRRTFYLFMEPGAQVDEPDCIVYKLNFKWPEIVLFRYHIITDIEDRLRQEDAIFHVDADMLALRTIGDEILPETICAVLHQGAIDPNGTWVPLDLFEKRRRSLARVRDPKIEYHQGCLFGGLTDPFLAMCRVLRDRVAEDERNGVRARFLDESHLNWWLQDHPHKSLSRGYAQPEPIDRWWIDTKMIHRTKDGNRLRKPKDMNKLVVGIVTFNNLPMLQKCFASWRNIPNSHLVVWDNGSEADTVAWLKEQAIDKLFLNPTNAGLCVGRNRIMEYNRETMREDFILLMDSDVLFHDGSIELMLEAIRSEDSVGMVGFGQANQGFPVGSNGYVEEISNECVLSRMSMWREIGMFPESLTYYSSDSWKSTLANMHGWKTKVVTTVKGYDHFAHGSHVNKPVPAIMRRDQEYWLAMEKRFAAYWRQRLLVGKGNVYKADMSEPNGADWLVPDEIFEPDDHVLKLIKPTVQTQFTNWIDAQALIHLMARVNGNYLEVGCHHGLTLMQLAYNFPSMTCYGLDYSGTDIVRTEEQQDERPAHAEIGWHVRPFRNVKTFDAPVEKFQFEALEDVALTFIDANLTYEGVKEATERVLTYYYALPVKRRIIAWHDYTPLRLKQPGDWIGTGEYVRKELAERFVCRFVRNTNLAYMIWNGER